MTPQLPLKPRLGLRETAPSYVARLAAINRCSPAHICRDMEVTLRSVAKGKESSLLQITRMTGISFEALKRHSLVRDGELFHLHGQVLTRPALRRARTFACPICVKEDVGDEQHLREARTFCRDIWILDAIRTCLLHGVFLVEIYPQAEGAMIYDFATAVLMSTPWNIEPTPIPGAPSPFEQYLIDRLDGVRRNLPWLDGFPWYAAARLCEMLGAVSLEGPRVRTEVFSFRQWYDAGVEGYRFASRGAEGIRELLGRLREDFMKTRADWGLRSVYGRLYEWLAYEDKDPAFDPLREVFRQHAISTMPFGEGEIIFEMPVDRRIIHSVHTAHKATGLHPKRLRKLLIQAGLVSEQDLTLSNDRILFDADRAVTAIQAITGSMKLTEVGKYFNIPRAQLGVLFEAGFLKPFVPAGTANIGSHAFSRDHVDQFRDSLFAEAVPTPAPTTDQLNIPMAAKKANCSAAEVVNLILEGKLAWKGIDPAETGYLSLLVDLIEIKQLVRRDDHGGIKLRDTETRLRVSSRVLKGLIAGGHLPAHTVINPVNRCPQSVVMENDLAAFEATYISLTDIASQQKKHAVTVRRELGAAGVSPAFDPAAVKATFYRRDSIPVA
ncbi:MAG: hypothetical protein E6Q98_01250 [Rhodospirillaceae bacterium]|nr:MAG: hypothetical protein E6Q98_01250 [Rhodospirillaceae bacterium]